jgi:hypothetical protein
VELRCTKLRRREAFDRSRPPVPSMNRFSFHNPLGHKTAEATAGRDEDRVGGFALLLDRDGRLRRRWLALSALRYLARKIQFPKPIQADLGGPVPARKIFRFTFNPNHQRISGCPVPARGAVARRHERGTGCGGRESVGAPGRSQGGLNPVSDRGRAGRTAL